MKIGLIAGRHQMPVDLYVFPNGIEDVLNFGAMFDTCSKFLKDHPENPIDLYVTGLTAATVAFINAVLAEGDPGKACRTVTLYHYDMKSGKYLPQTLYGVIQAPYGY